MRPVDADAFDKVLRDAQLECKKNGGNFRYGVLATVRANLEKAPTVGGWISVKDRLPEAGVKCLIRDMNDAAIGMIRENGIWQWADGDFYAKGGITHRMPLPEPPEEDENG